MIINRNSDGTYCATSLGAMGRVMVAEGKSWMDAAMELKQMEFEQECECYHHEQSMTALSIQNEPQGSRYQ